MQILITIIIKIILTIACSVLRNVTVCGLRF
jgi:hypothetical protein